MATKDFSVSENQDRENKSIQNEVRPQAKENKQNEETEIKNAHATGDGSFGRNDGSVPDKEAEEKKDNSAY